jgi:hypothetical protein
VQPGQAHAPLTVKQSAQDITDAAPMQDPPPGPESAPLLEPEPLLEPPPLEELFMPMQVPPMHVAVESQEPLQHGSPALPQLGEPPSWWPPSLPERFVPFVLEHAPARLPPRSKAAIPATMRFM